MTKTAVRDDGSVLLVLCYHNIERTWCLAASAQSGVKSFARQMSLLRRTANVVPLDVALDALRSGDRLPPRSVAITFDDGYRDNLELAVPVLQRYELPATVFLVPGFLSREKDAWWERLGWAIDNARATAVEIDGRKFPLDDAASRLTARRTIEVLVKAYDYATRESIISNLVDQADPAGVYSTEDLFLDWSGARDLVGAGVAIGSHTMDHSILSREDAAAQRKGLMTSRELLQDRLGVEAKTLAYPNGEPGDYSQDTIDAAQDAGYANAVTTWGRNVTRKTAPYEICRKVVSTEVSALRLNGIVQRNLYARYLPQNLHR